ncbi:MAG: phosphate acyltransferase PlsX [Verrucomicrobiota bacterium]|nr:phosphate acyltransferase PlsX [Verrucomicrobiota bacterium]
MRVSLDAMGGDHAPQNIIEGAALALRSDARIKTLFLVGDESRIKSELEKHRMSNDSRVQIVHASQVVEMDEDAIIAVRRKKDSSLSKAVSLVNDGKADIVISAGNTGAYFSISHLKLRTLEGVDRPGLACLMPGRDSRFILMDAGANIDPKPEHMLQYAYMGSLYAEKVFGIKNPRIGLYSIGTEENKGNDLIIATHQLLKTSGLNFCGNFDGHEIFSDKFDVLITDALTGNTILKTAEDTFRAVGYWIKKSVKKSLIRKIGALLMKGSFADLKKGADPDEFGCAVLLGINGLCLKAHGSASPRAIQTTIHRAGDFVQHHFNDHVIRVLKEVSQNKSFPADALR